MCDIFSEVNMLQVLNAHLPAGETIQAGIHGIGLKMEVIETFEKCVQFDDFLVADEQGSILQVHKSKDAGFDAYIGVTEHCLLVCECDLCKHYYEFETLSDAPAEHIRPLTPSISLKDIGICFPLADIKSCDVKKVWMGAVNCSITFKNGSFLKLQLPKRGGLGGGMPHHAEYRDAIIARLQACGA